MIGLSGYNIVTTDNSSSNSGSTVMYIYEGVEFVERPDLKVTNSECESNFIEVITDYKSIIIGTIYRHPDKNVQMFMDVVYEKLGPIYSTPQKYSLIFVVNININTYRNETQGMINYKNLLETMGCKNKPCRLD